LRIFFRIGLWIAALTVFLYLCGYAFDVHKRTTKVLSCRWNTVPNPTAKPYTARWCKLTKDTVLLRLYAANADQVLAERMFFHLDRPTFYWEAGEFGYATSPDGGVISLPPTLLDRLRARLP
jgi:hypothetical protein